MKDRFLFDKAIIKCNGLFDVFVLVVMIVVMSCCLCLVENSECEIGLESSFVGFC